MVKINPKADYHRLNKISAFSIGAIGGAIGAQERRTLDEALGTAAPTFERRHIAEGRRESLRARSITTVEELVGAARAVPDRLAELVGKDVVEILRSSDFRNSVVESFPALQRFPEWEEKRLTFGANIGKPPSRLQTKGLGHEQTVPRSTAPEFSIIGNNCMPKIRNQGDRWTCVAFATCAVVEYAFCRDRKVEGDLSEQYHYWDTKCNDPAGYNIPGTYPEISFSQAKLTGICREETWPYDMINDPPQNDPHGPIGTVEARNYRVTDSIPVANYTDTAALKRLIQDNHPVAITIPVYDSWALNPAVYDSGNIGMPLPGETAQYGHALVLVGFADDPEFPDGGFFIIRNSYGEDWGSRCPFGKGYGTIPYAYIAQENMSAFFVRIS